MFALDLTAIVQGLSAQTCLERHQELLPKLPPVSLVALNGIPFRGDTPTYFGAPVTPDLLQKYVREGLGFGSVLTRLSHQSLEAHADNALVREHDWALHGIRATLCFARCPGRVELAFARDRRFHLSWVEFSRNEAADLHLFTASASLKDWRAFLGHRSGRNFQYNVRLWMELAHEHVRVLLPAYFDADPDGPAPQD
jgi:hypothetical protein